MRLMNKIKVKTWMPPSVPKMFKGLIDVGEKTKGDPMDLRLDIERRKKYSGRERDYDQDGVADSRDTNREKHEEKFPKKSNESKCSRSRSSSSSSSSKSLQDDVPKAELKSDSFNRARLASTETAAEKQTPWREFQVRFRGRGWKKGNHPGDCDPDIAGAPKNEDWDKESPPKSRAYYLHDDRDAKGEASKQMDNRGGLGGGGLSRGWPRFIIRKTNVGGADITWAQDKFLVNGEKSGMQEDHTERQKKDGNT